MSLGIHVTHTGKHAHAGTPLAHSNFAATSKYVSYHFNSHTDLILQVFTRPSFVVMKT